MKNKTDRFELTPENLNEYLKFRDEFEKALSLDLELKARWEEHMREVCIDIETEKNG